MHLLATSLILAAAIWAATSLTTISSGIYPNCSNVDKCVLRHFSSDGRPIALLSGFGRITAFECADFCTIQSIDQIPPLLMASLQQLLLNDSGVAQIGAGAFSAARNLSVLDLSYNRIDSLGPRQFSGAPQLRSVRLSHNRIVAVDATAFVGNQLLEEIFLDHNRLTSLDWAGQLPASVEALHVQGNRVRWVPAAVNRAVRMLDVSNNQLIGFDPSDEGIPSSRLEQLNVARNQLADLHNITGHAGLRSLDISYNPILKLHIFTFARLQHLQQLRMRRIGLRFLGHGLFGEHAHLRLLDIGGNRDLGAPSDTERIDWTVLERLEAIEELVVDELGLSDLGPLQEWRNFVTLRTNFARIALSGNRMNCTYLGELVRVLRAERLEAPSDLLRPEDSNVLGIWCNDTTNLSTRMLENDVQLAADEDKERIVIPKAESAPNCSAVLAKLDAIGRHLKVRSDRESSETMYRRVAIVEGVALVAVAVMVFWFVGLTSWWRQDVMLGGASGRTTWRTLSETL